jgi:ABC-type multidrug transport system fused ATPase/permease subunit
MFSAVRLSLEFLTRRERLVYFTLVAVRALAGLLDVFGIVLIGVLVAIAAGQASTAPVKILGYELPALSDQQLVMLVLFVLLIFALKAFIAIGLSRVLTAFIATLESENATRIARLILRGSLSDVQKFSKSEVQWAVTGSTTYAFTGLLNSVATFATEGLLLLFVGITFVAINPLAALIITVYFVGIILVIQLVIGKSVRKAGVDSAEGVVGTTSVVNDTLDTFREISVLNKQEFFIDRFAHARSRLARSSGVMAFLGGMPRYVVETALILGVVLFVGGLFLSGQLASGLVTVGVFLTGGVRIMASLLPLQNAVAQVTNQVEQAKLAQGLLVAAAASEQVSHHAHSPLVLSPNGGFDVVVEHVDFSYPGNVETTLKDVSLKIVAGQNVALIGPSGAGKTTIVDLLLGLVSPDSGTVTIGGVEPARLRESTPGLISYVPQKPGLVSGTIAENVALGVLEEDIDLDRVRAALDAAHLSEFIESLPGGLNTSVGKQADALSGGQIQRLGLARALYSQPRLLILDEATSALDAGAEAFVSASLAKLGSDVTVITIAHRLSTVQHSDAVHVVEGGRITASGKFSVLRKSVPMVAEYVKLMSFDEN